MLEWLANNLLNVLMFITALGGGIAFAMNLDNRLKSIEKEQQETKSLVVISARLEERIRNISEIVLAQGKRLDRVIEKIYGYKRYTEEDDDINR